MHFENNLTSEQESKKNSTHYSQSDSSSQGKVHKCLNCGWSISETADICENCGEWLLKGKCNFCYTDYESGQKFCSECGNPPEGIICSSCGTLSHFDFCPQCNIPLTEQAAEAIELLKKNSKYLDLKDSTIHESPAINQNLSKTNDQYDRLNNYLSRFSQSKTKKKKSFSLNDNPDKNIVDNLESLKQAREKLAEEERKQRDLEAKKLLDEIQSKTFSNNQEARRFFNALKIVLQTEEREPIGWRCNAYGVTHSVGPHECADPSKGGTWIYQIIKKEKTITI